MGSLSQIAPRTMEERMALAYQQYAQRLAIVGAASQPQTAAAPLYEDGRVYSDAEIAYQQLQQSGGDIEYGGSTPSQQYPIPPRLALSQPPMPAMPALSPIYTMPTQPPIPAIPALPFLPDLPLPGWYEE